MKQILIAILRAYRLLVSPLYGQTCRYYPSCSAYALNAVEVHGAVRGPWLAVRRVVRCHPWTPGGVDLVPPPEGYRWWGRDVAYTDPDSAPAEDPDHAHPHHAAGGSPTRTGHPTDTVGQGV